jgi:membrane protease YdiL (CAAX protease family)
VTLRTRLGRWLSLDGTPIGLGARPSRRAALVAGLVGVLVMAVDVVGSGLEWWWRWPWWTRLVPAAAAVAALVALGARPRSLGLWGLRPSTAYWLRTIAAIAVTFGAFLGVAVLIASWLWPEALAFPASYDGRIERRWLLEACVVAPLVEETIWRLAALPGLVAALGRRWAVVVDGAGFAALHVAYGVASPDNFVGGYIFAWVYLRGGSLWLCMALHGAANLCVVVGRSVVWHMLHG